MPHTSRRKKSQTASKKLVNVSSDDGWSVVSRKCDVRDPGDDSSARDRFINVPPEQLMERLTLSQADSLPAELRLAARKPLPAEISLQQLRAYYEDIRRNWLSSETRARTMQALDLRVSADFKDGAEKIVCLGLGSMSASFGLHRKDSIWQLALYLDLADHIRQRRSQGVTSLYAQDPVFNEVDTAMLDSCGVEVLQDPAAFAIIDEKTIVFAPHYPVALWSESMREGRVLMIIGNSISDTLPNMMGRRELEEYWRRWNPDKPVDEIPDAGIKAQIEALTDCYDSVEFPATKEEAHGLNGLRIYCRKTAESPT